MDDVLAGVDWGTILAGGSTIGLLFVGFRLFAMASTYAVRTYKDAGDFEASRVGKLEADVTELRGKVDDLEQRAEVERKLKHDWRSFSGSLLQERWTIRRFAELHGCTEIVDLMDRLDQMRADNPLMTDAETLVEGDP